MKKILLLTILLSGFGLQALDTSVVAGGGAGAGYSAGEYRSSVVAESDLFVGGAAEKGFEAVVVKLKPTIFVSAVSAKKDAAAGGRVPTKVVRRYEDGDVGYEPGSKLAEGPKPAKRRRPRFNSADY